MRDTSSSDHRSQGEGARYLGLSSSIAGWDIIVVGDMILASKAQRFCKRRAEGLKEFVTARPTTIRTGWVRTADYEILYVYDRTDGFGYAFNVDAPDLSEWGYSFCPDRQKEVSK